MTIASSKMLVDKLENQIYELDKVKMEVAFCTGVEPIKDDIRKNIEDAICMLQVTIEEIKLQQKKNERN